MRTFHSREFEKKNFVPNILAPIPTTPPHTRTSPLFLELLGLQKIACYVQTNNLNHFEAEINGHCSLSEVPPRYGHTHDLWMFK